LRTPLEAAAGQLVSAISKVWSDEMGEPGSDATEQVMHESHNLLKAAKRGSIANVVGGRSVAAFLGVQWVEAHSHMRPFIEQLEREAQSERAV
jgi:hypothetical protein